MPIRNPQASKRFLKANLVKTQQRIEGYHLLQDLLRTWESQSDDVKADNHEYIIHLRAKLRNWKNYILNRSGPESDVVVT